MHDYKHSLFDRDKSDTAIEREATEWANMRCGPYPNTSPAVFFVAGVAAMFIPHLLLILLNVDVPKIEWVLFASGLAIWGGLHWMNAHARSSWTRVYVEKYQELMRSPRR